MISSSSFRPAWPLKNPHVQTVLASTGLRALGRNPMCTAARPMVLKTPDGVRLLGYYSVQRERRPRGLVILLHGWEGSANSTYMLCTGRRLFNRGYNIFRLNFRDHGGTHHLNQGIFYAILLEEVFQTVRRIAGLAGNRPVFLVGFSLGGNFVLRILQRCHANPIDNLRAAVAVSPVLDPEKATHAADQNFYIRQYFLHKWRRSLRKKQALFPDVYDFSKIAGLDSILAVTEVLLQDYTDFASAVDYFRAYAVVKDALRNITVPTTIITAADDPIIPVQDFHQLQLNGHTHLVIQPLGGHNGFLEGLYLRGWYEKHMATLFDEIVQQDQQITNKATMI